MSKISETLRATILSLKSIGDKLKVLIATSVTKSEAESAKQDVLDAIDAIPEPDLSTVAKQGTDPDVTLTGVDAKIDDFYDSFDADIASQLNEIIGEESISGVTGTTQTEQQIGELRTLQESYSIIANEYTQGKQAIISQLQNTGVEISDDASMQEVADAMPNFARLLIGNTEFAEDSGINTLGDVILSSLTVPDTKIKKLHSDYVVAIPANWLKGDTALEELVLGGVVTIGSGALQNCLSLKKVKLESVVTIPENLMSGCTKLVYLDLPSYEHASGWHAICIESPLEYLRIPKTIYTNLSYVWTHSSLVYIECKYPQYLSESGQSLPNLRHLYVHDIVSYNTFGSNNNNTRGYDYRFFVTDKRSASFSLFALWGGFSASSQPYSPDEWDDPDAPHFDTLGDQVLWYFKKYILYNAIDGEPLFEDMTGQTSPTLTLPSAVKTLVMADAEVAEYFSSRNWTIA